MSIGGIIFFVGIKTDKKSPEGNPAFRALTDYKIMYDRMIRPLIGGGIRGFVVECGIVGQGGVGDVVYPNGKGTGGFDFVRHKAHGAIGPGNA